MERNESLGLLYLASMIKGTIVLLAVLQFGCGEPEVTSLIDKLSGEWVHVKSSALGFQKFSEEEAKQIGQTNLVITKHGYSYPGVTTVVPCVLTDWAETTINYQELHPKNAMKLLFSETELEKWKQVSPQNTADEYACNNDCAAFYLKGDTLINICGGWTYFLVRADDQTTEETEQSTLYVSDNEEMLYSFRTTNGKRMVLVIDNEARYMQYRFGNDEKIELTFPEKQNARSFQRFSYTWYMRGGGIENEGMNYSELSFDNGDYRYIIGDNWTAREEKTTYEFRVLNRVTKKETNIEIDTSSIEGYLGKCRDIEALGELED